MLAFFLALAFPPAVHAQAEILPDPMRPAGQAAESAQAAAAPAQSGVSVVLTSPGRKLAVIDGEVVRLGGEVRDGTLVGLSDSSAVLKKDGGRDVLLVHPGIDKRPPPARRKAPR